MEAEEEAQEIVFVGKKKNLEGNKSGEGSEVTDMTEEAAKISNNPKEEEDLSKVLAGMSTQIKPESDSAAVKKKKKEEEKEKEEKAAAAMSEKKVPKHVRDIQQAIASRKEYEERMAKEEQERQRKEEEERLKQEEIERQAEEAGRRKKEKEKEKILKKKQEGKLLTGKQKEERRRLEAMRNQILANNASGLMVLKIGRSICIGNLRGRFDKLRYPNSDTAEL